MRDETIISALKNADLNLIKTNMSVCLNFERDTFYICNKFKFSKSHVINFQVLITYQLIKLYM